MAYTQGSLVVLKVAENTWHIRGSTAHLVDCLKAAGAVWDKSHVRWVYEAEQMPDEVQDALRELYLLTPTTLREKARWLKERMGNGSS